jgi:hypothetical protein
LALVLAIGAGIGLSRHHWKPALQPTMAVGGVAAVAPVPDNKLPDAGRRHLEVAQGFATKFWCSAAIDELETGMHDVHELRGDPQITRMMIPCLRAKTQDKTLEFLVTIVGRDAKPTLQAALNDDLKPDVRDGVQKALARIAVRADKSH